MRATILPQAIILTIESSHILHVLTQAHRAVVSMMAVGCIVA